MKILITNKRENKEKDKDWNVKDNTQMKNIFCKINYCVKKEKKNKDVYIKQ